MHVIAPVVGVPPGVPTGIGVHPDAPWVTFWDSTLNMRGMLGPVRSTSRTPTVWPRRARERASWTVTEDLPTPPLPERTWGWG